jgi:hypothetical protein
LPSFQQARRLSFFTVLGNFTPVRIRAEVRDVLLSTTRVRTETTRMPFLNLIKSIVDIDDEFICPLSLEIMENPVYFTVASGNSTRFERVQILKVLLDHSPRHPIT